MFLQTLLLVFGILLSGQTQPALSQEKDAKPIAWDAVTFLPWNNPMSELFIGFIEKFNERAKGMFNIKYKGGPEVISDRDQINALRTGFIKIIFYSVRLWCRIITRRDSRRILYYKSSRAAEEWPP